MATVVQTFLKCACPAEGMETCRFWRFDAVHMFICRHLCCDLNPSLVKLRKILNSPFIFKCHIMPFFESPSPLVLPSFIYLPMLSSFSKSFLLCSSSSASSSAASQIHLCLFFSFHVTAAIFSPYLEPAILIL